jgi:hypothetical protein
VNATSATDIATRDIRPNNNYPLFSGDLLFNIARLPQ